MWKTFYQEMPSDNCRIVALYGDGSEANVFLIKDGMVGELQESPYENKKATFIFEYNKDDLEEMGYFMWAYLPDNFKLWGEE